jgi:pimeloyl-ACP methyl ester carboxylesterase
VRYGYASTPCGDVHHAQDGAGEPLLLLHATPRSHRYFRHMLPLLAPHCRAIAVDTPGFGNSHALPEPASIRSIAECFVHCLDALGIERAHVFGLHTGNKIAAALAADWPDRVGRVVLAGQTHSLILDKAVRDEAIRQIVEHYFPQFGESPDGAHHVRHWAAANAELQALWWPQRLRTAAAVGRRDVENAEAQVIDYLNGRRSIVPVYQAIFSFDMEETLRRIEAPTLVLELLTPQETHFGAQAERLAAIMKRGRAVAVQGDGDLLETDPSEITGAVMGFLRSQA